MSCTTYIVYTFHLSLHHANFGQFKAKQVLWLPVLYSSYREMLLSRRARQEILDTLMLNETDQILHIPTTINQLKLNLDDTQK